MKKNKILLGLVFVEIFMLCGCKEEAPKAVAKAEVVQQEVVAEPEEVVPEKVETPKETTEVVEEESVVEEPVEELYIPEGIDMESTLSGEEWLASFVGKVAEPVVVVYNDDTGRKEVVQANLEVTLNPDEDIIAVYWPKKGMRSTSHAISVIRTNRTDNYEIYYELDAESMRDIPERPASITVKGSGEEDWVIEFTIIVE